MRKKMEKENPEALKWKAPFTPYLQYLTVILIACIFIGQFFVDGGWKTMLAGIIWLCVVLIYYQFIAKKSFEKGNTDNKDK